MPKTDLCFKFGTGFRYQELLVFQPGKTNTLVPPGVVLTPPGGGYRVNSAFVGPGSTIASTFAISPIPITHTITIAVVVNVKKYEHSTAFFMLNTNEIDPKVPFFWGGGVSCNEVVVYGT